MLNVITWKTNKAAYISRKLLKRLDFGYNNRLKKKTDVKITFYKQIIGIIGIT